MQVSKSVKKLSIKSFKIIKEVKMSNIYHKAWEEYLKFKELYLNNKLPPNDLNGLRKRKKYFKDDSYEIHDPMGEGKSKK